MRDRLDELGDTTDVVLITFTDPANLADYAATNELPFPILIDSKRAAYAAYGLGRGSVARVYGWKSIRRYIEILRAGNSGPMKRATEDTLQLGGDFIVDADGLLAYGFWGAGPDDRPSVDDLVNALT